MVWLVMQTELVAWPGADTSIIRAISSTCCQNTVACCLPKALSTHADVISEHTPRRSMKSLIVQATCFTRAYKTPRKFFTMVHHSFLSTIRSALSNLFTSETETAQHFLEPYSRIPVTLFHSLLAAKVNRTLVESCVVTRVIHCKHAVNVYHELLVLEITSPSHPDIPHFLYAERADREGESCGIQSSAKSPSSSSASVSSSSNGSIKARDQLFVPDPKSISFHKHISVFRQSHRIIHTITFSTEVSLAQVMVMMQVLSNHSQYYDLFRYRCYWYATRLFVMLQEEFPSDVRDNNNNNRRAGRYGSIPMTTAEKPCDVAELLRKYHIAWANYHHKDVQEQQELAAKRAQRERELAVLAEELAAVREQRERESAVWAEELAAVRAQRERVRAQRERQLAAKRAMESEIEALRCEVESGGCVTNW